MRHNPFYYWRLFGTGFAFSLFGLGGLLSGITVFPLIAILPITATRKTTLSRSFIRLMFRFFIWFLAITRVVTHEIHGGEKLRNRSNLLIIANHPTLLDVVFLIAFANRPNCVVKQGVWRNPFMYFVVRAARFIQNSNSPDKLLQECVKVLQNGDGLIIFPEGTRTDQHRPLRLKRGVVHIALQTKQPLTPVIITCNPISLTKAHRWYHIPEHRPSHFSIHVEDDILLSYDSLETVSHAVKVRQLTEQLHHYFTQKIEHYG